MASGSPAMLRRAAQTTRNPEFTCSRQASSEHFQQCAEFLLLCNRGLGALAVTSTNARSSAALRSSAFSNVSVTANSGPSEGSRASVIGHPLEQDR